MRPFATSRLAELLGGTLSSEDGGLVYGFATDHREARAGDAFLAIRGARFDGHDFAAQAFQNGAVIAVVERPIEQPHILVPDLVQALARMARTLREDFHGPVIGVTGSAGKTTTKELIAAGLQPLGKVLKTVGNRNTEYTGPLLWADLEPDTAAVVVEMAMRGFGQIAHLARFSRPTVGLVTNIGYGHLEMVGSREGIARAKGELIEALPADGSALLWQEDEYLEHLKRTAGGRPVRTFGFSDGATCRITRYQASSWSDVVVEGVLEDRPWRAKLPAPGRHLALNAAAAVLACDTVGVNPGEAAERLEHATLPGMRMEVRSLHGASLLLDTYNASPPAMLAAIETLMTIETGGRRLAVVGEMKELGEHTEALHREVGRALAGLDAVLFYGDSMTRFALGEAVRAGLREARSADSLDEVRAFLSQVRAGDAVLVKGSRALELERALEEDS